MADEKTAATTATASTSANTAAASAATQEPAVAVRYTFGELKEAAFNLFGYGPEALEGAFYGKDKTARYTVKEARDAVTAFLEKPVKEG